MKSTTLGILRWGGVLKALHVKQIQVNNTRDPFIFYKFHSGKLNYIFFFNPTKDEVINLLHVK